MTDQLLREPQPLAPGQVVGDKYRLIRRIGAGGMGSVYEAEHVPLGRTYALKFLRHDATSRPRAALRFEREARLLSKLNHENIVALLDVGLADGQPYLVLELIHGRTLRQELTDAGVRGLDRVLNIAVQVARGLGHAHAAGIIHRDLKPENVMLSEHADGRLLVKVLDFGVARLNDDAGELMTNTGAALGTAAYMSPEQARGDAALDEGVDVFALGVIVYEALSGKRPYEGSSYNETLYAILNKAHRPLAKHRPDLPDALTAAVERALAKMKAERYASVAAFVTELRRAAGPALASSLTDVASASESATLDEDAEERAREPSKPAAAPRSFRLREVLAGAALGIAGTLLVAQRSETPQVAPESVPVVTPERVQELPRTVSSEPRGPEADRRNLAPAPASASAVPLASARPASFRPKPAPAAASEPSKAPAAVSFPATPATSASARPGNVLAGEYLDENPYTESEVSRAP